MMTDDSSASSVARAAVARTAEAEPGRLRRSSAAALLALLSAAALAPLAVVNGSGLSTALAGVAGNIGGGLLSGVIDKALERLRDGKPGQANAGALRDEIATGLLAALERDDAAALELRAGLTDLLVRIGGVEAAIDAARDDVRSHLRECFGELALHQDEAIRKLRALDAAQRRQERRLRAQAGLIEEMADRLRLLTSLLAKGHLDPEQSPPRRDGEAPMVFQLVAPSTAPPAADNSWTGGAQIIVGECAYLLYSGLLEERLSADRTVLLRQAQALLTAPAGARGQEHVWLRQVEARPRSPAAHAALAALGRERALLAGLRHVRGLPRATQLTADGGTTTLALRWPPSRSLGGPCQTLAASLGQGGPPVDSWYMFRLFTGLAGLCVMLAGLHEVGVAHRNITPAGVIVLDDGLLVLRDAGLAALEHRPGEGPADYQAPEQRHGGASRPGPPTDSYQLAALAYHLMAGHPPHPRMPLPLRAQVPKVPDRASAGIVAALAADPARRPSIRSLGEAFSAARDDLS